MPDDEDVTVEEVLASMERALSAQDERIGEVEERVDRLVSIVETLADEAVTDDEVLDHVRDGVESGAAEVLGGDGEDIEYPEPEDRHFQ